MVCDNERNDVSTVEKEQVVDYEKMLEETRQILAAERERAEANLAGWQRAAADLANYRKRVEQERNELIKTANADLIRRLLPIVDDMERAFQAIPNELTSQPWVEGIQLIKRKFLSILEQEGVTPFDSLGQPFDPAYHEAITMEETDEANDGKVVGEIQKGYRFHDRVLRPALVRVGRAKKEQV